MRIDFHSIQNVNNIVVKCSFVTTTTTTTTIFLHCRRRVGSLTGVTAGHLLVRLGTIGPTEVQREWKLRKTNQGIGVITSQLFPLTYKKLWGEKWNSIIHNCADECGSNFKRAVTANCWKVWNEPMWRDPLSLLFTRLQGTYGAVSLKEKLLFAQM